MMFDLFYSLARPLGTRCRLCCLSNPLHQRYTTMGILSDSTTEGALQHTLTQLFLVCTSTRYSCHHPRLPAPLPPPTPRPPPPLPPPAAAAAFSRFLRNRLKQANDAAVKNLSSLRALYRLSLASGGGGAGMLGGGGDAADGGEGGAAAAAAASDPHPHITALATVLGEGSKLMVRLAESSLGDGVMEPVAELLHGDSKAQVSRGGAGGGRCRCVVVGGGGTVVGVP